MSSIRRLVERSIFLGQARRRDARTVDCAGEGAGLLRLLLLRLGLQRFQFGDEVAPVRTEVGWTGFQQIVSATGVSR